VGSALGSGEPVVAAEGLAKSFMLRGWRPGRPKGAVLALAGVDLAVRRGSIHGVIGPNGSGKSTLLRILGTMVLPDGGSARIDGHDVVADPLAVRRRIGLSTGEERGTYWRLSARHNLEFMAALFGMGAASQEIDAMLELVGLEGEADRPVSGFSQGMARRLGLARAMLHRPPVLLLDEPTRSLDPAATEHFHHILQRVREHHGVTTILTTHDLGEAATVCDDVSAMHSGRITGHVSPDAESSPHQAVSRLVS
jgi:ABC-2 type transport system ATP-binding protein